VLRLSRYRHKLVQMRTRAKNSLQALAFSAGSAGRSRLLSWEGRERFLRLEMSEAMGRLESDGINNPEDVMVRGLVPITGLCHEFVRAVPDVGHAYGDPFQGLGVAAVFQAESSVLDAPHGRITAGNMYLFYPVPAEVFIAVGDTYGAGADAV
jgi:hypothetical protein